VPGKMWERSLGLLEEMREARVFPDGACYSAAITVGGRCL
jgi:hypothetical protein